MKTTMAYLENIFLILLAGFLCWYFHNFWGLVLILFLNSVRVSVYRNIEKKIEDIK